MLIVFKDSYTGNTNTIYATGKYTDSNSVIQALIQDDIAEENTETTYVLQRYNVLLHSNRADFVISATYKGRTVEYRGCVYPN